MSVETANRKKRANGETTPAPEGDHRKRRRNRTTQSCLNCHTSKRMCDRKRPACARCTQLGLTGLCVYEVDDPSQRSDSQDESSRLLKRVAELEGVIRELKNKPHPRWVQTGNTNGDEFEKWNIRSQLRCNDDPSSNASSPPSSSSSSSEKGDNASVGGCSTRSSSISKTSNIYPPVVQLHPDHTNRRPSFCNSSPQSTPSPSLMTPTEEFSQPHFTIATPSDVPHQDYDLASMFLGYPGLMGCEDNAYGLLSKDPHHEDSTFSKHNDGHCGCLHESSSYNVVLELSLRLRKAADVLARSSNHQMGTSCLLNQHISDLDAFATTALGNIASPPEEFNNLQMSQDRSRQMPIHGQSIQTSQVYCSKQLPTISPQSLQSLRSWEVMPTVANSPSSCDDSFMSWEPPPRRA